MTSLTYGKPFLYEICLVDCEQLIPVLSVDDAQSAYEHILLLEKQVPGDYLIFERQETNGNMDLRLGRR